MCPQSCELAAFSKPIWCSSKSSASRSSKRPPLIHGSPSGKGSQGRVRNAEKARYFRGSERGGRKDALQMLPNLRQRQISGLHPLARPVHPHDGQSTAANGLDRFKETQESPPVDMRDATGKSTRPLSTAAKDGASATSSSINCEIAVFAIR